MGDIISLVDSIQEEYLTPIPLRYKNMAPEPMEPRTGEWAYPINNQSYELST